MYTLRRFIKRCFPHRPQESELSASEVSAIRDSWLKARHAEIGKRILLALIDKKPKFAEYYGIKTTLLSVGDLGTNENFNLQAQRIQYFLDTVVASLGFCSDDAIYSMARRIGQIHYYKGVNFGADNWLAFKRVTIDQIILYQHRKYARQPSTISFIDINQNIPENLTNSKVCMATIGWSKLMAIIIREMKRGFLEEAQRSCRDERSSEVIDMDSMAKYLMCKWKKNKVGKDPDEVWSNLYREKEKNSMYRWVAAGELAKIYETQGEDGILTFADDKLVPNFYEDGSREINFEDFCKWKRQQVLDFGLEEDDSAQFKSRFLQHTALWRLNKRGVDGENLVHLLLKGEDEVHHEIARILIKNYPGLAGDICLSNDFFGQSALHLAIVNNDYETCELLLKCGADVNARASGDFFMPTDAKRGVRLTDYEGWAYYGEYPLAFAACFGSKDIYDLLLDYGADPNLKDTFGNTILHICVISQSNSMYSYAVQHWLREADPNLSNNNGFTPLTLAARLGRKTIFYEMLELSKVEYWRFYNVACSAYPMTAVDTVQNDGSFNYESAVQTVVNGKTESHLDMIGSEVIQRLMMDKWEAFARWGLIKRMIILVVHCISVSVAAGLRPTELDRLYFNRAYASYHQTNEKSPEELQHLGPRVDDWFRLAFEVFSYAIAIVFWYQQYMEVRAQGIWSFVMNMRSTPARVLYAVSCGLILFCLPLRLFRWTEAEEVLIVIIVPATYAYWLFFCRTFKLTGPFVQMIYSMIIGDLFKFILISSIFMFPFAIVFTFLGQDIPAKQKLSEVLKEKIPGITDPEEFYGCKIEGYTIFTYQDTFETLVSLFRASLGGYDYEELSCTNYELATKLLFVVYMLCMPVVMINILIAMMGNTYTTVIERAEKAWRQQYAQIVLNLERSLDRNVLMNHMIGYTIKLTDTSDARGLMVMKRTRTTKKQERITALSNWQTIGGKVVKLVNKLGVEYCKKLLHGYAQIDKLVEDAIERRPPTRAQWPQVWKAEDENVELVPNYAFLQPPKIGGSESGETSSRSDVAQLDVQGLATVVRSPTHLVGSAPSTSSHLTVRPGHVTFHEHFQVSNLPNMPTATPIKSKIPKK